MPWLEKAVKENGKYKMTATAIEYPGQDSPR